MEKKKSIADLSRELKISTTTISYVLNGIGREKRISQKVIDKVEKYIKEVGYRPDFMGRSLRTGKSMTIGLVVGDLVNPFFSEISSEIEKLADQAGYSLMVACTNNEYKHAQNVIKLLVDRKVDGIVIASTEKIQDDISALLKQNMPTVLYDRYFPELPTCNVVINNMESSYIATEHLYNNGYRNIVFVSFDLSQNARYERLEGYKKLMESKNLKPINLEIPYNISSKEISESIVNFLNEHPETDSIFFSTNLLTLGGLLAIKKLEITGRKMGIVSFDDHVLYEIFTPSITAVKQPLNLIATTVMDNLLSMMQDDGVLLKQTTVLPTELKIRQSSLPKT